MKLTTFPFAIETEIGQGFTLPRLPFQVPSQELASAPQLACADNSVAVRIVTDRKPRPIVMDSLSERRNKKTQQHASRRVDVGAPRRRRTLRGVRIFIARLVAIRTSKEVEGLQFERTPGDCLRGEWTRESHMGTCERFEARTAQPRNARLLRVHSSKFPRPSRWHKLLGSMRGLVSPVRLMPGKAQNGSILRSPTLLPSRRPLPQTVRTGVHDGHAGAGSHRSRSGPARPGGRPQNRRLRLWISRLAA